LFELANKYLVEGEDFQICKNEGDLENFVTAEMIYKEINDDESLKKLEDIEKIKHEKNRNKIVESILYKIGIKKEKKDTVIVYLKSEPGRVENYAKLTAAL